MKNDLFNAIARCTTELPVGTVSFGANPYVPGAFGVRLTWDTCKRKGAILHNIPVERHDLAAQILLEMLNTGREAR